MSCSSPRRATSRASTCAPLAPEAAAPPRPRLTGGVASDAPPFLGAGIACHFVPPAAGPPPPSRLPAQCEAAAGAGRASFSLRLIAPYRGAARVGGAGHPPAELRAPRRVRGAPRGAPGRAALPQPGAPPPLLLSPPNTWRAPPARPPAPRRNCCPAAVQAQLRHRSGLPCRAASPCSSSGQARRL
jgi:hypothetical protein